MTYIYFEGTTLLTEQEESNWLVQVDDKSILWN